MTKKEWESWQTILLGIGLIIVLWVGSDHDIFLWTLMVICTAAVLYHVRAIIRIRRAARINR